MSPHSPVGSCARCDVLLGAGASHYTFAMQIISGFDGVLAKPEKEPQQLITEILERSFEQSSEELEDSVALSRTYTICPACRAAILKDPLQRGGNGPSGLLS